MAAPRARTRDALPTRPTEWEDFNAEPTRVELSSGPRASSFHQYQVLGENPRRFPSALLACREGAGEPHAVMLLRARRDLEATRLSPQQLVELRIEHEHVAPVLDFVRDESELLAVVDFCVAESLDRLQARGNRLPIPISVAVALDLLSALERVHAVRDASGQALAYGTLTPQTVLVHETGKVQLFDVGLIDLGDNSCLSGAPGYAAPEQVFDQQVDARSDLFSVGVCLWESLTGRRLLAGSSFVDGMLRFISDGLPLASRINPEVSGALTRVVSKALEPTPERRFQSAREFASALKSAARAASPAEVARYLQGVAWASFEEQRATRSAVEQAASPLHTDADAVLSHGNWSAIVTRGQSEPSLTEELTPRVSLAEYAEVAIEATEDQTVRVLPDVPIPSLPQRLAQRARLHTPPPKLQPTLVKPAAPPSKPQAAAPSKPQAAPSKPQAAPAPTAPVDSHWNATDAEESTNVDGAAAEAARKARPARARLASPVETLLPATGRRRIPSAPRLDPLIGIRGSVPAPLPPEGFAATSARSVPSAGQLSAPRLPSEMRAQPSSRARQIGFWFGVIALLVGAAMTGRYAESRFGLVSRLTQALGAGKLLR